MASSAVEDADVIGDGALLTLSAEGADVVGEGAQLMLSAEGTLPTLSCGILGG